MSDELKLLGIFVFFLGLAFLNGCQEVQPLNPVPSPSIEQRLVKLQDSFDMLAKAQCKMWEVQGLGKCTDALENTVKNK